MRSSSNSTIEPHFTTTLLEVLLGFAIGAGLVVMGACGLAVRTYWLTSIRGAVPNRTWFPLVQLGYWLPCYLDWFAVGMLLAVASARVAAGGGPTRVLPAIARRAWVCWGLAAMWVWVITRSGFPALPWRTFGAWEAWWWDLGALAVGTFLVLPALVPELGYDDLAIQDGGQATAAIYRLLFDESLAATAEAELRRDLLAYCERDTFAMVELLRVLRGMA